MATIKVHGSPYSTATMRVTAILCEKQLEFELVYVNVRNGDHKKEPFISQHNVSKHYLYQVKISFFFSTTH
jgi:glutathione S-transferase